MPQSCPVKIQFAVCLVPLVRDGDPALIQIFPAGEFSVPHGALHGAGPWRLDEAAALRLIEKVSERQTPLVIDYEHQSLLAISNGQPAPAAGWVDTQDLRWTAEGLFGAARWTDRARGMIEGGEYAYLSPVFLYEDGVPTDLLNMALTNNPAIDGMAPVMLAAATTLYQAKSEKPMDDLLNVLRGLLNLPVTSTAEDIAGELDKLKSMIAADSSGGAMAMSLIDLFRRKNEQIAAASAASPDPAKYAPVATVAALQAEVAALRSDQAERDLRDLIEPALSDGRVLPAQEQWAWDLGRANMAALKTYLDTARPAVPATSQTRGRAPAEVAAAASAFPVPDGHSVDARGLEVHGKAVAYLKSNPGVSYLDAVTAVGG